MLKIKNRCHNHISHRVTKIIYKIFLEKSNEFSEIANKLHFEFSMSIWPRHENVTVLITWLTRDCDFFSESQHDRTFQNTLKSTNMCHKLWLEPLRPILFTFRKIFLKNKSREPPVQDMPRQKLEVIKLLIIVTGRSQI